MRRFFVCALFLVALTFVGSGISMAEDPNRIVPISEDEYEVTLTEVSPSSNGMYSYHFDIHTALSEPAHPEDFLLPPEQGEFKLRYQLADMVYTGYLSPDDPNQRGDCVRTGDNDSELSCWVELTISPDAMASVYVVFGFEIGGIFHQNQLSQHIYLERCFVDEGIWGDGGTEICDDDPDGDGIANFVDNCPQRSNLDQGDADGDGLGDACDFSTDSDLDGVSDSGYNRDNCIDVYNPDQENTDGDWKGDACDNDDDNDGVDDVDDNCPLTKNYKQDDEDGDGIGDLCDPDYEEVIEEENVEDTEYDADLDYEYDYEDIEIEEVSLPFGGGSGTLIASSDDADDDIVDINDPDITMFGADGGACALLAYTSATANSTWYYLVFVLATLPPILIVRRRR